MKLVLDMNLSPDLAPALAALGHDAPDESVLAWAWEHGRVVVTHDLDFSVILATTEARGPSVVQIREHDLLSDQLAPRSLLPSESPPARLEGGAIVTLHAERSRIRILPLGHR